MYKLSHLLLLKLLCPSFVCFRFYSVKVHIWGELTETMTPLYEEVIKTPIIIILSSARVGMYKGNTYF